jgi:hypothetical protein
MVSMQSILGMTWHSTRLAIQRAARTKGGLVEEYIGLLGVESNEAHFDSYKAVAIFNHLQKSSFYLP